MMVIKHSTTSNKHTQSIKDDGKFYITSKMQIIVIHYFLEIFFGPGNIREHSIGSAASLVLDSPAPDEL